MPRAKNRTLHLLCGSALPLAHLSPYHPEVQEPWPKSGHHTKHRIQHRIRSPAVQHGQSRCTSSRPQPMLHPTPRVFQQFFPRLCYSNPTPWPNAHCTLIPRVAAAFPASFFSSPNPPPQCTLHPDPAYRSSCAEMNNPQQCDGRHTDQPPASA